MEGMGEGVKLGLAGWPEGGLTWHGTPGLQCLVGSSGRHRVQVAAEPSTGSDPQEFSHLSTWHTASGWDTRMPFLSVTRVPD